jgi:hypothetical protein
MEGDLVNAQRRKGVFAIAAVVLLGLPAALTLHDPDPRAARDLRPGSNSTSIRTGSPPVAEPTEPRQSSSGAATPAPTETPGPPRAQRSERESSDAPAIAPREGRAATAAARSFLDGYLRYSYGRARARRIQSATASLLRELEGSPPRVPAAVARSRPRLISVRAQAATSHLEILVRAVVDDGQRRYSIPLSVRDRLGRWLVTAVGG